MRLFVSEYICGGGWSGGERPASLVREGAAMLRAVVRDLLRIPSLHIATTWDQRLDSILGVDSTSLEVVLVSGPEGERETFARLCRETDAAYVIAPELDDELSTRCRIAHSQSPSCRNCSQEAIDLCGDKWALYQHFQRHGIPTIPTQLAIHSEQVQSQDWPRVLKLRMGAGSQAMQLVSSPTEWDSAVNHYDSTSRATEAIAQPWVRGVALSVGVIVDRGGKVHLLPVADQHIDPQRGFLYLGGRIPSAEWDRPLDTLLQEMLSTIPGLVGYFGVDLLIPEAGSRFHGTPLIIEINPRLTTSYVGYQKLCRDNLAALWLGDEPVQHTLQWEPGGVEFNSAGECRTCS